jgi:hypothetical protein
MCKKLPASSSMIYMRDMGRNLKSLLPLFIENLEIARGVVMPD